ALADEVCEHDEGFFPGPALVVPDLFPHRRREVPECLVLVVDGKTHRDGGFQGAGGGAREHEVEGADLCADVSRERATFRGKVRTLAAFLAFLRGGVASDLDRAHGVNNCRRTIPLIARLAPGSETSRKVSLRAGQVRCRVRPLIVSP